MEQNIYSRAEPNFPSPPNPLGMLGNVAMGNLPNPMQINPNLPQNIHQPNIPQTQNTSQPEPLKTFGNIPQQTSGFDSLQSYYFVKPRSEPKEGGEETDPRDFVEAARPLPNDIDFHKKGSVKKGCPMGDRWLCSLILTLLIFILTSFGVGLIYIEKELIQIPVLFGAVICCMIYLLESCTSKTPIFLSNIQKDVKTDEYLEKLKHVGPRTVWIMENYHYVTRTSRVNTKSGTRTRTSRVRSYTFKTSKTINYPYWNDLSPKIQGMDRFKIARLHCSVDLVCSSPELRNQYYLERQKFIQNNITDKYYDFKENHIIPGLNTPILSLNEEESEFLKNNKGTSSFVIATLLFYGWFIRFYLFKHSKKVKYPFVKLIHQFQF